jgi:hypothetical protein
MVLDTDMYGAPTKEYGNAVSADGSTGHVVKTIRKLDFTLLCSQHNPVRVSRVYLFRVYLTVSLGCRCCKEGLEAEQDQSCLTCDAVDVTNQVEGQRRSV